MVSLSVPSQNNNFESHPIEPTGNVKDLGIYIDCDATFNSQIEKLISKAKNKCSWILRTFETRDKLPMLTLYKSLVIPILDYCSQIWSPAKKGHIQNIEEIQRSFTRKIKGTQNMDYWQRLKFLNLYSLERRRERYSIMYTWKILEHLVPSSLSIDPKIHNRRGRECTLPPLNTRAAKSVQNLREGSFSCRGPRLFNKLPREIRGMSCSVNVFKRALDSFLKNIPDNPLTQNYTAYSTHASNSLLDIIQASAATL